MKLMYIISKTSAPLS